MTVINLKKGKRGFLRAGEHHLGLTQESGCLALGHCLSALRGQEMVGGLSGVIWTVDPHPANQK